MDDQERKKIKNAGGFRQGLEEIKERIDAMIDDGTDHPNPHEPAMRQALAEIKEWNPGCAKAIEDFIVAERRWFHEFANLLIDSDYFQCLLREVEPKERSSLGGARKAAAAAPSPEKQRVLDYAAKVPSASAQQIKMRLGLKASERSISRWRSAT